MTELYDQDAEVRTPMWALLELTGALSDLTSLAEACEDDRADNYDVEAASAILKALIEATGN